MVWLILFVLVAYGVGVAAYVVVAARVDAAAAVRVLLVLCLLNLFV